MVVKVWQNRKIILAWSAVNLTGMYWDFLVCTLIFEVRCSVRRVKEILDSLSKTEVHLELVWTSKPLTSFELVVTAPMIGCIQLVPVVTVFPLNYVHRLIHQEQSLGMTLSCQWRCFLFVNFLQGRTPSDVPWYNILSQMHVKSRQCGHVGSWALKLFF